MSIHKQIDYVRNLPEHIKNSISWYTGGNFDLFNESLRNDKIPSDKHHFDNIVLAFKACPPLTENVVVYKGIDNDRVYEVDKAFSSSSYNISGVADFHGQTCCILEITISPGSKILPIFHISRIPSENEILLDRNGKFILTGTCFKFINDREWLKRRGLKSNDNDMKFLQVTYIPQNSIVYESNTNNIKDPEEKDETGLLERIILYMTQCKEEEEDLFDLDYHINRVLEKFNLDNSYKKIIKLRFQH